jgi:hypothetical protein
LQHSQVTYKLLNQLTATAAAAAAAAAAAVADVTDCCCDSAADVQCST